MASGPAIAARWGAPAEHDDPGFLRAADLGVGAGVRGALLVAARMTATSRS